MSDENKSRRCSFELFPDERTGDKIADELIANEKLKEDYDMNTTHMILVARC